jgi:hypothetical protein
MVDPGGLTGRVRVRRAPQVAEQDRVARAAAVLGRQDLGRDAEGLAARAREAEPAPDEVAVLGGAGEERRVHHDAALARGHGQRELDLPDLAAREGQPEEVASPQASSGARSQKQAASSPGTIAARLRSSFGVAAYAKRTTCGRASQSPPHGITSPTRQAAPKVSNDGTTEGGDSVDVR